MIGGHSGGRPLQRPRQTSLTSSILRSRSRDTSSHWRGRGTREPRSSGRADGPPRPDQLPRCRPPRAGGDDRSPTLAGDCRRDPPPTARRSGRRRRRRHKRGSPRAPVPEPVHLAVGGRPNAAPQSRFVITWRSWTTSRTSAVMLRSRRALSSATREAASGGSSAGPTIVTSTVSPSTVTGPTE